MKFKIKRIVKLFDQIEKYNRISNILGIGDPHVVKINNQWWMFIGGFQTNFKNNIFTATLPVGESLNSDNWSITTFDDNLTKAKPLIEHSGKGSWDYYGYHTPCYVAGRSIEGKTTERIYYTGRASRKVVDNEAPYSIGVIEKTSTGWTRYQNPIVTGTNKRPNVLEPKVRYVDGLWRMWYVTTAQETGKTGYPDYRINYIESKDGLTKWSEPVTLFQEHQNENFYDASVHPSNIDHTYEMLVSRSTNLYGRKYFPGQGIWWLRGDSPNGDRKNWSKIPYLLLDAEQGEPWYRNGIGTPNGCYGETDEDQDRMYIFFTGIHKDRNWLKISYDCLRNKRTPPFPSPFYFTIGMAEIIKSSID
ncbi:hypothetical protein FZW96_01300 [Bacillus sp. BGMRC 2118]|nr:hypothetical protein FZW96_01300 [Bacillus sp. BGMRC 2118]